MHIFCQSNIDNVIFMCYTEYIMDDQQPSFDTTILRKAGLTESQAKGYLALIQHGSLSPGELAERTNETRNNGYMICEKLEKLGLATKKDGKKTVYMPESPTRLKQLLINRQKRLKEADTQLAGILPTLLSTYRLATDKPGAIYLEGLDSLQKVYDDIIQTGKTLRIFPSAYDRDDPDTAAMIDSQIERQRAAGIKTEVLLRGEIYRLLSDTKDQLFEARPTSLGPLDAQVLIYGDNIALTTFQNGVVTTVITSPPIANTFNQLFENEWSQLASNDT